MRCPRCNSEVESNANYCKHCAFDLSANVQSHQPYGQANANPNHVTVYVALGVAVVTLAILFVYIYNTRHTQATSTSITTTASNSETRIQTASTASQPDPSRLTNERVLGAVKKAFDKLIRADRLAPGASATVIGIQDIPAGNAARADLDLSNAAFLQTDMLSGKWEVGPGGYGGRMVYSKKKIRIEKCTANLKRYTNGKWVLESLDTHSYEFGTVKVDVAVD